MDTILDILKFCYDNDCSPRTIVFENERSFDNLDSIVKNWHLDHNLEGSEEWENSYKYQNERFVFHKAYEFLRTENAENPHISVLSYNVKYTIKKVDLDMIFRDFKFPIMIYNNMRKVMSNFEGKIPKWFSYDKYEPSAIHTKLFGVLIKIRGSSILFRHDKNINNKALLQEILIRIESEVISESRSKFVVFSEVEIDKPWERCVMADIITNDPEINQAISVYELLNPLHKKRFITSICMNCKFTIIDSRERLGVKVSSPESISESLLVMSMVKVLFRTYEENYEKIHNIYSPLIKNDNVILTGRANSLKDLRREEPGLFINNYTRECPILPIMIVKEDLEKVKGPYILYHKRYYTSPEGYYVGLKLNRLSNKNEYKYLVTCYKTNHFLRENSLTYKYTYGIGSITRVSHNNYRRINSEVFKIIELKSFSECVEIAFNSINKKSRKVSPLLCKQELWFETEVQLANNIENGMIDSRYYRYYEELYLCNIIIINLSKGDYDVLIHKHMDEYIWNPHWSNKGILIIEVPSPVHIREGNTYELVIDESFIFDITKNRVYNNFVKRKKQLTIRGLLPNSERIRKQYIDYKGKCVSILCANKELRCYYSPLYKSLYYPWEGLMKGHFNHINTIRKEHELNQVLWDESNEKYLFFPNKNSFNSWIEL